MKEMDGNLRPRGIVREITNLEALDTILEQTPEILQNFRKESLEDFLEKSVEAF